MSGYVTDCNKDCLCLMCGVTDTYLEECCSNCSDELYQSGEFLGLWD